MWARISSQTQMYTHMCSQTFKIHTYIFIYCMWHLILTTRIRARYNRKRSKAKVWFALVELIYFQNGRDCGFVSQAREEGIHGVRQLRAVSIMPNNQGTGFFFFLQKKENRKRPLAKGRVTLKELIYCQKRGRAHCAATPE